MLIMHLSWVVTVSVICPLSSVGYTTSSSGVVKALNVLQLGKKEAYFQAN